jgi:hypothetical protein
MDERTIKTYSTTASSLAAGWRDVRPFATARHSWLFSDTVAGAKASAMVYSLLLTCRACNVEPYAYLHHVPSEMPQRASDLTSATCCRLTSPNECSSLQPTPEATRSGVQSAFSTSSGIGRSSVGNMRVLLSQRGRQRVATATSAKIAGCSLSHQPAEIIHDQDKSQVPQPCSRP